MTATVEVERPPKERVSSVLMMGHVVARFVSSEMSIAVPSVDVIEGATPPTTVNEVQETPVVQEAVEVPTPNTPAPPLLTSRLLDAGWVVVASPTQVNAPEL